MKLFSLCTVALSALLFAACGDSAPKNGKTLIVMTSGKIKIDKANPTVIELSPSNQSNVDSLAFGEEKVTITVKGPDGDKTYDLPENGVYVLNLKKDTITGSAVNFGSAGMPTAISGVELDNIIDSTQKVLLGQNVSDANKTFWLTPYSIKKITANLQAKVLDPATAIPYRISVPKDGSAPEYYKFITNSEKRETLNDLIKRMRRDK